MENFPLLYFPSEVVFFDDSEIYLQSYALGCENQSNFELKTFLDVREAASYIASKPVPCFEQFLQAQDTFCSNCYAMKLNVFSLHKMIYDPSRFSQVSVILADYFLQFSPYTGLDFCRQQGNNGIQKILFTSQTDRDFIIDAFNENCIQRYVAKQEIASFQAMIDLILQAQERYFFEKTKSLRVILKENSNFPLAIYSDDFYTYFKEFLRKNNIKEYYLLDAVGSFLMIDNDNHLKVLFVQNEDQCRANYLEQKDEVDSTLRSKLQAREVIYCNTGYWTQDQNKPASSYFLPAECIQDLRSGAKFYCACLENVDFVDTSKIAFGV